MAFVRAVLLTAIALLFALGCNPIVFPSGVTTVTVVGGQDPGFGGRVTNPDGSPAQGVSVTLLRTVVSSPSSFFTEDAITDSNGDYRFSSQTPITQVNSRVYVNQSGYGGDPLFIDLSGASSGSSYNFTLRRLLETGGTILNADGVTAPPPIRVNFLRGGVIERSTTTDPLTGRYGANLLEGLIYEIVPSAGANYLPHPDRRLATPGEADSTAQNFSFERIAYGIYGTVRYNDGTPVWGRAVIATGSAGYRAGYTNQEGRYVVDGLAPDTYTVTLDNAPPTFTHYTITIKDADAMNVNFSL